MPPPGATESASQSPVGDHSTLPTGSLRAVTRFGQPPLEAAVQICGVPVMSQTKANVLPSGEKVGEKQRPIRAIRVTAAVNSSLVGDFSAADENKAENKRTAEAMERILKPSRMDSGK